MSDSNARLSDARLFCVLQWNAERGDYDLIGAAPTVVEAETLAQNQDMRSKAGASICRIHPYVLAWSLTEIDAGEQSLGRPARRAEGAT